VKSRLLSALLGSLLTALLLAPSGLLAAPYDVLRPLLANGLVRAEIVTRSGGALHDYRVDKGRIRAVRPLALTLTLREADGTVATIPLAPGANVTLAGRPVELAQLRRGMQALTIRDGDAAATRVVVTRR
jgi:hypothetical protein